MAACLCPNHHKQIPTSQPAPAGRDLLAGKPFCRYNPHRPGRAPARRPADASVAQRQSTAFVKRRLWVRFPPLAFVSGSDTGCQDATTAPFLRHPRELGRLAAAWLKRQIVPGSDSECHQWTAVRHRFRHRCRQDVPDLGTGDECRERWDSVLSSNSKVYPCRQLRATA